MNLLAGFEVYVGVVSNQMQKLAAMKRMKKIILFVQVIVLLVACTTAQNNNSIAPTHEKWSALLQKYVTNDDMVNYKGMKADQPASMKY